MPQVVWISHQIWSRSVSLLLGPKYGHGALCSGFAPNKGMRHFSTMGDAWTKAGAVLFKKAEPRHAVYPMGAGEGGADPAPKTTEKIDDCVPSV